jgi:hypothetical protein
MAACAWLAYAGWELLVQRGIACGQACNIRVDLLLVTPVLLAFTSMAIVGLIVVEEAQVRPRR